MKQQFLFTVRNDPNVDRMIYLNGSKVSFRCDCGCNVFREYEYCKYRCNSCEATYTGSKEDID